jgi:hypothetical protein
LASRFRIAEADIEDPHGSAVGCKLQRNRLPNTASATRDHGDLAVQSETSIAS